MNCHEILSNCCAISVTAARPVPDGIGKINHNSVELELPLVFDVKIFSLFSLFLDPFMSGICIAII